VRNWELPGRLSTLKQGRKIGLQLEKNFSWVSPFKELVSFLLLDHVGDAFRECKSHSTAVTFIYVNFYSEKFSKELGPMLQIQNSGC
jgi:hypothetical protein